MIKDTFLVYRLERIRMKERQMESDYWFTKVHYLEDNKEIEYIINRLLQTTFKFQESIMTHTINYIIIIKLQQKRDNFFHDVQF